MKEKKFVNAIISANDEQQALVLAFIKGLEAQKEIDKSA